MYSWMPPSPEQLLLEFKERYPLPIVPQGLEYLRQEGLEVGFPELLQLGYLHSPKAILVWMEYVLFGPIHVVDLCKSTYTSRRIGL